jgi:hypothetical protein
MFNLKDYLPDLKGALTSVHQEQIQKHLLDTKKALIIIAVAIFFLLLIAYF